MGTTPRSADEFWKPSADQDAARVGAAAARRNPAVPVGRSHSAGRNPCHMTRARYLCAGPASVDETFERQAGNGATGDQSGNVVWLSSMNGTILRSEVLSMRR